MQPPKIFYSIALLIVILDQLSKYFVKNYFPYTTNTGAAFGILQGQRTFLIFITIIILGVIFYHAKHYPIALGFLFGGAISNLIDRIFLGKVIDFIDLGFWPSFNIADSSNTLGVGILLFLWIQETINDANSKKP
tara:strand:+ start:490 stop:894 length:405 start_codon:yes stop_codon:yes gene_type:complete